MFVNFEPSSVKGSLDIRAGGRIVGYISHPAPGRWFVYTRDIFRKRFDSRRYAYLFVEGLQQEGRL